MTNNILPKEAQRLLDDDTLKLVCTAIRLEALEALATAPAHDTIAVLRLQQRVQAIEDIRSELQSAATRTNTANSAGTFA